MKKLQASEDGDDSSESIEARLDTIEKKVERLRSLYESFFLGVERMPPNVPRREANRLILEMQQAHIANASIRFRFQGILQKWSLYTTYWNRTMREIEAGTYRRDLARAQRHMAERGSGFTEADALALGIPARRVKAFVETQNRLVARRGGVPPPAGAAAAGPARPGAVAGAARGAQAGGATDGGVTDGGVTDGGVTDGDIDNLHRRYMEAHRQASDPRPPLTLDEMRQRLRTQIPKVLAAQKCRRVTFGVAIEAGQVKLKAWPVRE